MRASWPESSSTGNSSATSSPNRAATSRAKARVTDACSSPGTTTDAATRSMSKSSGREPRSAGRDGDSACPRRRGWTARRTVPRDVGPALHPRDFRARSTRTPNHASSVGRSTWSRYSYDSEKDTLVPPAISTSIGSPSLPPANRRKGRVAWRMSRADAAGEAAAMRMGCSLGRVAVAGPSRGWKVSVLLPTLSPTTEASVASASHSIEVTCWDLRPGGVSTGKKWTEDWVEDWKGETREEEREKAPPPRGPSRLPRTLVMWTGCEVTAARATAIRTSCPPPSPVRPSSSIGLGGFMAICRHWATTSMNQSSRTIDGSWWSEREAGIYGGSTALASSIDGPGPDRGESLGYRHHQRKYEVDNESKDYDQRKKKKKKKKNKKKKKKKKIFFFKKYYLMFSFFFFFFFFINKKKNLKKNFVFHNVLRVCIT